MRRTVAPSAEIEAQIDQLLAVGVGENPRESLSELAKLGARLIIGELSRMSSTPGWGGLATSAGRRAPPGSRNGFRPRRVQTAEGELSVEIPQVREAAQTFASKLFPRTPKLLRTEPLKALVIGAFVRGLSMRDVESLCEQAGLGKLSKSTASRICQELRERFEAFTCRSLYDVHLVALFLDATFISVRPSGPKEGVLVAWGFTEDGERVLLAVMLGMRESYEDWQALGRDRSRQRREFAGSSIPSKHDPVLRRHGRYRRSPRSRSLGCRLARRSGHLIATGTRAAPTRPSRQRRRRWRRRLHLQASDSQRVC